jgi:two-component sensor histidine kinase
VDGSFVPQGGLAMLIIFILGISIMLQFTAVILAWRMIPITGGRRGWLLICAAIFMMAVRRCITLFLMISRNLSGIRDSASADDWVTLVISAFMVVGLLRIGPLLRSLKDATKIVVNERNRFFSILEELPAYVYLLAPDYSFRFANRLFRENFGDPGDKYCYQVLGHGSPCDLCTTFCVFETKTFQSWEWDRLDGHTYQVSNYPFSDVDGFPLILVLAMDITEIRKADKQIRDALFEKEILLREIHHRVKNNLASLISLMELQTAHIRDAETIRIFKQLQSQLMAMSLVHKNLYQAENMARIDFREYLEHLIINVFQIFGTGQNISLNTEVGSIFLNIDTAIPCGLIVNEILSNALKYAFPDGKPCRDESGCEVYVMLAHDENNKFMLIIRDNGAGLPKDIDWRNTDTLGLKLVNMLSRQLRAELDVDIHNGTTFKLIFAEQKSPDFNRQN